MFIGEVSETRIAVVEARQCRRGALVVAVCGRQPRLEELGAPGIPTDHVGDLRVRHSHHPGGFGHCSVQNPGVDGQAIADAPNRFSDTVIGGAPQIDLAQLCEGLQREIVPVLQLDLRQQRQQHVPGRQLVGGEGQPAGAL